MRIALVINGASGAVASGTTPEAIREKLVAAGIEPLGEADRGAPLPVRIAAAASEPGIDALVVAGGDGTIACAAAALVGKTTPLGILPLGTLNLLARDLGVPLDIDGAVAALVAGGRRRIDVGEVNGRTFLINSVLGLPARVTRHREAHRRHLGLRSLLRWVVGILRHLGRYPRLTVTGTIDGAVRTWRFRLLAVVIGDYVERPGHMLVRAPLDAGRLTLYVLAHLSLARTLRLALGFALGDWRRLPDVERVPATNLAIASEARALRVMNDGEVTLIPAPLRYRIHRQALTVIVPKTGGHP
ncbi:diacylglycerol kinase family protein [Methylobacterium sp. ARG-1]|uniref:diacylglycerol/lipid kinase family protein n=1 Tax=Methylobacterium sp. ARG-1 TaxID=1692501 RepID=UPI0006836374|nr:diacylglycerol kinase family protein [Methylobacterium sp. ARG-1]KNY22087.1 DeoR faimly transcriptional regulator [Methylobacterium sp. ARG-1]